MCVTHRQTHTHTHTQSVDSLMNVHADANAVNEHSYGTLYLAARNNAHQVIPLLVGGGAAVNRVDAAGFTPLLWAASVGATESARELLVAGADVQKVYY